MRSMPKPRTDVDRILELPVREPPENPEDLTKWFRRPYGTMSLWPVQNWALQEITELGGLVAPIGVGLGKTLISFLAPEAFSWHTSTPCRALLLIRAKLREKTLRDQAFYNEHFRLPSNLEILTYRKLSQESSERFLEDYRPNLIIADEGHALKSLGLSAAKPSTRAGRVARYFKEHPETGFVVMSGTITSKSVNDFAHLCAWALKDRSPLPLQRSCLRSLAACIDATDKLPDRTDIWRWERLFSEFTGLELPADDYWNTVPFSKASTRIRGMHLERRRDGFRRRLVTTPGVVTTPKAEVDCSLILDTRKGPEDPAIESALQRMRSNCELPQAEAMFCEPAQIAEASRQIAQGFYYVWDWPDNIPDYAWLEARSQWNKAVRSALQRNRPGLDSELLLKRACGREEPPSFELKQAWEAWGAMQHIKPPPKRVVWISRSLIDDALGWLKKNDPGIIWLHHSTALESVFKDAGVPYFGAGDEPPEEAISCAMSIGSQGEGKNLQMWSRSLILCPPSSGAVWEQLLGRTHRPKQLADEVWYTYYNHLKTFRSAMRSALKTASYLERVQGPQKLLYCTKT